MLITVDQDQSRAPGCYLICKVSGSPGRYDWNTNNESSTVLVQSDLDFPSLAAMFGWAGDPTNADKIEDATEFLDSIDYSSPASYVEDPGYFS